MITLGLLLAGAAVVGCELDGDTIVGAMEAGDQALTPHHPIDENSHEKHSALVAEPGVLLLADVGVGELASTILRVRNVGETLAQVSSLDATSGPNGHLTAVAPALGSIILQPGAAADITVQYVAAVATGGSQVVGNVRVGVVGEVPLWVPVYAASYPVEKPSLDLSYPGGGDCLTLGAVATGAVAHADVILRNTNDYDVWVTGFEFTGARAESFGLTSQSFAPAMPVPSPGILKAGDWVRLTVFHFNETDELGTAVVQLGVIGASGAELSSSCVAATLVGEKTCQATVTPPPLAAFAADGPLRFGESRTVTVEVMSAGTGPCFVPDSASAIRLGDCAQLEPHGFKCEAQKSSAFFEVIEGLPAGPLHPGDKVAVQLRFVAPPAGQLAGPTLEIFPARVDVVLNDPHHAMQTVMADTGLVEEPGQPNVAAFAAGALLDASPSTLDLGLTALGCGAVEAPIALRNRGRVALTITELGLTSGCGATTVSSPVALPTTLGPGAAVEVTVGYPPGATLTDCALLVDGDADSGGLVVPIQASASHGTARSQSFLQPTPTFDVVVVVDQSPSMAGFQGALYAVFDGLLAEAAGTDYRVAVVTADAAGAEQLLLTPGWITPDSPAPLAELMAAVDTDGSCLEQGLEAALQAAHTPGLLRPEATLEIVIVSDENDVSPGAHTVYGELIAATKGLGSERVRVHAVVGTGSGACALTQPKLGSSYAAVAGFTGGLVADICGTDFRGDMSKLVTSAVTSPMVDYWLKTPAATGSPIAVSVGGLPCGEGWSVSADGGVLSVEAGSECAPEPGETIQVDYQVTCP